MNGNDFVKLVLRSPLHALIGDTLLITLTGCRSGRKITTPVNYYRRGDELWILSSRDRTWWRNARGGADVVLHLDGSDVRGFAEVVHDEEAVAAGIGEYIRHLPLSARSLGVCIENGVADSGDAARAARDRRFVKVCLSGPAA